MDSLRSELVETEYYYAHHEMSAVKVHFIRAAQLFRSVVTAIMIPTYETLKSGKAETP